MRWPDPGATIGAGGKHQRHDRSVDPEHFGLVSLNNGLKEYFARNRGFEPQLGMTPEDLVPPDFVSRWREHYSRALREGPFVTEYLPVSRTHILLLSFNLLKRDGQVFGVSVFGKDISERKRMEKELRVSSEQLRALAARLQTVREEERIRVAREIHDVLAQELTSLKIDVALLTRLFARSADESPPSLILEKLAEMATATDTAIHSVQKIATDLRPVVLDSLGLCAAIEWQAADFQSRTGISCKSRLPAQDLPLDRDRSTALFRIFQESLTNVARHAEATQVEVSFAVRGRLGDLDGPATMAEAFRPARSMPPAPWGCWACGSAPSFLGGRCDISGRPGQGTTVMAQLPLHPEARKHRPSNENPDCGRPRHVTPRIETDPRPGVSGAEFGEAGTCQETLTGWPSNAGTCWCWIFSCPVAAASTCCGNLEESQPELPVLVLSSAPEEQMATRALRAGAAGYLNKQAAPEELARAVRKIAGGGRYVSAKLADKLATDLARPSHTPPRALVRPRVSGHADARRRQIRQDYRHRPRAQSRRPSARFTPAFWRNSGWETMWTGPLRLEHHLIESPPRELG